MFLCATSGSAQPMRLLMGESNVAATDIRRLMRQIQHAAGLDPDGPRLVPMRPAGEWCEDAEHYRKLERDAMLRHALRFL